MVTVRSIVDLRHIRLLPVWRKARDSQGEMILWLLPFRGFSLWSLVSSPLACGGQCFTSGVCGRGSLFTWWQLGSRMRKREEFKSQYSPSLQSPGFLLPYRSPERSHSLPVHRERPDLCSNHHSRYQNNVKKNLNALVK